MKPGNVYCLIFAVLCGSALYGMEQQQELQIPQGVSSVWFRQAIKDPAIQLLSDEMKLKLEANEHMSGLLFQGIPLKIKAIAAVIAQRLNMDVKIFSPLASWSQMMSRTEVCDKIKLLFTEAQACPRKCMIIVENVELFADLSQPLNIEFWQLVLLELGLKISQPAANYLFVGLTRNIANLEITFTRNFNLCIF